MYIFYTLPYKILFCNYCKYWLLLISIVKREKKLHLNCKISMERERGREINTFSPAILDINKRKKKL